MAAMTRRDWIKTSVATVGLAALPGTLLAESHTLSSFHYDHVLGTSLDVLLETSDAEVLRDAEQVILAEIERLRCIFSLYDANSELCRLNNAEAAVPVSTDLRNVLRTYERWEYVIGGACNPQVGAFVELWTAAQKSGVLPCPGDLKYIAFFIRSAGWYLDDAAGTVTRIMRYPLNLNIVAKGYVIQQVIAAVKRAVPAITGGLVNLGGDMATWGVSTWPVGIQDPTSPAENAPLLGGVRLQNQAVATSGGYQRYYIIDGERYSHLLDPRSGMPTGHVMSATVMAPDSVTANLLATTLCVLDASEGLRLIATQPGVECLIVTAAGQILNSPGFKLEPIVKFADEKKPADVAKPKGEPWPEGFQVTVPVELPKIDDAKRYRRPYVAVWIEDASGKAVRTLSVWGNAPKYLKDLTDWWKISRDDKDLIKAVTRATRSPGKYDLVWDGKDDKGEAVGQGTFTVCIEVHREHGRHVRQTGKLDCKAAAATLKLEKNDESGESVIEYAKKKKS
ncbi:hypothetical protein BH11PLA2_BH11PLA2_29260 [soil metagenome]